MAVNEREVYERVVAQVLMDGTQSEEDLDLALERFRPAFPSLSDDDVEQAKRSLTERLRIEMDMGIAVLDSTFEPWLDGRFAEIKWNHWLAYKSYLVGQNWPLPVVDSMDALTNQILEFAGDPTKPGHWARRGLTIGDVQSGKTATYLALFNKAVDAGYRLIIVLAGGTEVLRQQTQQRVDEGLIGRDSRTLRSKKRGSQTPSRYVGVGTVDANIANAMGLTTVAQDFRKGSYEATSIQISADSRSPYVFVLKKNKAVLNTLALWLDDQPKTQGRIPLPVLVLDDESDYASVNTRDDANPTAINDAIRKLLQRFSRSSYLAFTATPFANIFIDSDQADDLFPRDYVYALRAPSNYVGSRATFGTIDEATGEFTVPLDDAQDWLPVRHRSHSVVTSLNGSLREAIDLYFVANAVRDLRGDSGPRSMLINVSRYKAVQAQVFELVESESSSIRNALDLHSGRYAEGQPNARIDRLKHAFEAHYLECGHEWSSVLGALRNASARIEVQLHNSDRDRLLAEQDAIWDQPPRVIAVGGDVLSRGLTLNGLMISYFHRNVGAYDTLMQMARWFGYRDGYADLCRVWIDEDVASQYRYVQDAIDELRLDLEVMHQQRLTPRDFGLAVRKHPGALLVTARNKMKSAVDSPKEISLAGRRVEATRLSAVDDRIDGNIKALSSLAIRLAGHPTAPDAKGRLLWRAVPRDLVADFLGDFRAADEEALFQPGALSRFVRGSRADRLQLWDVLVVNGLRTSPARPLPGAPLLSYHSPQRSVVLTDGTFRISGKSSRLGSTDDVASLVLPQSREEVRRRYLQREGDAARVSGPSETEFYSSLERPVLFIYPLEAIGGDAVARLAGRPLVSVKLAIPAGNGPNDTSADVIYTINKVAQQKWFPDFTDDEDEEDVDS